MKLNKNFEYTWFDGVIDHYTRNSKSLQAIADNSYSSKNFCSWKDSSGVKYSLEELRLTDIVLWENCLEWTDNLDSG